MGEEKYKNYDNYDSKKDLVKFWGTQNIDEIIDAFLNGKDVSKEILIVK